jgi:transposase
VLGDCVVGKTKTAVAKRIGVHGPLVGKLMQRQIDRGIKALHDECLQGRPKSYEDNKVAR